VNGNITDILIEAIEDQQGQINSLKEENQSLKNKLYYEFCKTCIGK
jgi:hypothetical protein